MENTINQIVAQEAFDQVSRLGTMLNDLATEFEAINKKLSGAMSSVGAGTSLKEIAQLNAEIAQLKNQLGDAKAKMDQYTQAAANKSNSNNAAAKAAAEAARQVKAESQAIADNVKQAKSLEKAIEKMNKEKERQAKAASDAANAYKQLTKSYNDAAMESKRLGAEMYNIAAAGKADSQQYRDLNKQYLEATKRAGDYHYTLSRLEQAVGQHQRNVGNYANLQMEANQVMRELPNFAIDARVGIMSLSNNLPMLQDALQRTAKEIDPVTGKAIGMKGALKSLVSSIFSWQTALLALITVLIAYQDEIADFVFSKSAAERAVDNFNNAMADSFKGVSDEIAALRDAQSALADNTVNRDELAKKMDVLNDKFPHLFQNLQNEKRSFDEINEAIEQQINLLIRKAREDARMSGISKAIQDLSEKQKVLNEDLGFWDKAGLYFSNYSKTALGYLEDVVPKMSSQSAEMAKMYKEEYDAGRLSRSDYKARLLQLMEIEEATKGVTAAVSINTGKHAERLNALGKEKTELLELNKEQKRMIAMHPVQNAHLQAEIDKRNERIAAINAETDALKSQEGQMKNMAQYTLVDMLSDLGEYYMLSNKEGTAGYREGVVKKAESAYEREVKELKESLDKQEITRQQYDLKEYNAQLRRDKTISDYDERVAKKREKAIKKDSNLKQEQLAHNKAVDDSNYEQAKKANDAMMAEYESQFKDETLHLDDRLDALDKYYKERKDTQDEYYKTENQKLQDELTMINGLTEKYGVSILGDGKGKITDAETKALEKRHDIAEEDKKIMMGKLEVLNKISMLTQNMQNDDNIRLQEAADKRKEIIQNDTDNLIKESKRRFDAIDDDQKRMTALRLADLDNQHKLGDIGDKAYYSARRAIINEESLNIYNAQLAWLDKTYADMANAITDPAKKEALLKLLNQQRSELERAKPDTKRDKAKSWAEIFGIDTDAKQALSGAERALALYEGQVKAMEEAGDTSSFAYKLATANVKTYSEEVKKSQEVLKEISREEIYKTVNQGIDMVFQSISDARQRHYQEKFDLLDKEKQMIEDNYEAEKTAIEGSLMSEEEKTKRLKELNAKKLDDQKRMDAEQRKIRREQAIRERDDAIFKITLETAVAVAKTLSTMGATPTGLAAAAMTAALGVAQVAALMARPIPEYWQGTPEGGHKGGAAWIGERGTELGILPSGQAFLTPSTATLVDLPKGTDIIPLSGGGSTYEKLERIATKSSMERFDRLRQMMPYIRQTNRDAAILANLSKLSVLDKIDGSIRNIPQTEFFIENGEFRKMVTVNGNKTKFINKAIKG